MPVLRNISTLATCRADGGQGEIHAIPNAALAWRGRTIQWVGPEAELPAAYRDDEVLDAGGRLVIPGLVDCHTHLAFAGWRAEEFEQRLLGRSYLEIAAAGGGIASTVRATRAAGDDELLARAERVLEAVRALGVTTVEAKSGYGLTLEDELKLLHVYRRLAAMQPVRLVPTLLAAHTVPPEHRAHRERYVDLVVEEIIPRVGNEGLARCCDVFVEESAFSVAEGRRVLEAGKRAGLAPKVHADQLTASGGAELAAAVGALSADHLECVTDGGIEAMRRAGVVAVSLPIATIYLAQRPMPARRLIDAGVPVAVATDFNPGSAPSYDLPLAMMLACTLQRMTPAEVLKGATRYAAQAVGLAERVGSLEPGKAADFAVIDAPDATHWLYHFRPNACVMTVIEGSVVWRAGAGR
jgi:imidazolonepropionase